jgi:hypothetical protein
VSGKNERLIATSVPFRQGIKATHHVYEVSPYYWGDKGRMLKIPSLSKNQEISIRVINTGLFVHVMGNGEIKDQLSGL